MKVKLGGNAIYADVQEQAKISYVSDAEAGS